MTPHHINLCIHKRFTPDVPSCGMRGSEQLKPLIEDALARAGLVLPVRTLHCLGQCARGPNLLVVPNGRIFNGFSAEQLPSLVNYLREELAAGDQHSWE